MKIALLTTDAREHFRDYGNPAPYFGTAPEALLEGFKLLPNEIEVHVVCCLQQPPVSSPSKLANNIHYHALHVPKWGWMRTGYTGCIRAVRRKLHEIRPDVVHGQGTERDCAISAVRSGFPNVLTLHGVMRTLYTTTGSKFLTYYWFAQLLETFSLRRTDGIICISPFVTHNVAADVKQSWLVPNAIRSMFFAPPETTARRAGPPRLLNVGMIYPLKQQVEILRHLIQLRNTIRFEMTFIGTLRRHTPYTDEFLGLLASANTLYGGFRHVENPTAHQLLHQYDDADALLHFSKEESFGLVLAEAQARGLALFATDVGAIREIARENSRCHIFPPSSVSSAISQVRNWILSAGHLQTKDYSAAAAASARYLPSAVAKRHLPIYHHILNRI